MHQEVITDIKENYKAWLITLLNREQFLRLENNKARFMYLSKLAHLAANSHNTQPWAFNYNSLTDKLEIYLNTSRVLPASDINGRQAMISVGSALANIEVALHSLNISFQKTVFEENFTQPITNQIPHILVCSYEIDINSQASVTPNDLMTRMYHSIPSRRVDRGEYDHDRQINPSITSIIQNLGLKHSVKTILISDWGRKVALAELQLQADSFVINNTKFAEELINDWMIENDSTAELGMPGSTFRLSDEQTQHIKSRFKNNFGFETTDAASIAQQGKKGILSCQCIGLLTIENDTPTQWLNAGITLQQGALLFESHGIAWAVHAGLAEVSQVNMLMLRPIAMTTKRPVVLFRAGYLKANEKRSPHSPRLQFQKVWSES